MIIIIEIIKTCVYNLLTLIKRPKNFKQKNVSSLSSIATWHILSFFNGLKQLMHQCFFYFAELLVFPFPLFRLFFLFSFPVLFVWEGLSEGIERERDSESERAKQRQRYSAGERERETGRFDDEEKARDKAQRGSIESRREGFRVAGLRRDSVLS